MSIPNTFRPLCGSASDYVTEGLMLLFDASREPQGARAEITNLVTGSKIVATSNLNFYGNYFLLSGASIRRPVLPGSIVYAELVTEFRAVGTSAQVTLDFQNNIGTRFRSFANYPFAPSNHVWNNTVNLKKDTGVYGFARCGMSIYGYAPINPNLEDTAGQVGGIGSYGILMYGENDLRVHSVRLYDRELTSSEIMHNIKVDETRFKTR